MGKNGKWSIRFGLGPQLMWYDPIIVETKDKTYKLEKGFNSEVPLPRRSIDLTQRASAILAGAFASDLPGRAFSSGNLLLHGPGHVSMQPG